MPDISEDVLLQQDIYYRGDTLLAVLTTRNNIYLSVPSVSNALNLNARGQLQRIQRTPELADGICQLLLKTRGGKQRVSCLHLSKIHLWLTGVKVQNLFDDEQMKLERYQQEIAEFVMHHFLAYLEQNGGATQPVQNELPFAEQRIVEIIEPVEGDDPFLSLEVPIVEEQQELRTLLASIPYINSTTMLTTTSFQEDRAIREATLARKTDWEEEPEFNRFRYLASNQLTVYVGDPAYALTTTEALQRIRALGESTILTARILLGLWNIRRSDNQLAKDGSAAIRVDEILEWRGVEKHSRTYVGSDKRFTDGYQWKHKQQVHQDVKLLEQFYLRGRHSVLIKGRIRRFVIDGPYLRVTSVKETTQIEEGEPVGYFIAPGAWINTYEEHGNVFFAEVDRRIFQLNPQNEQIALRIALYLTEYWRQHARTGDYERPIVMHDLLTASMVPIDESHLTSRFAPRVEAALKKLVADGIIGEARQLTVIDMHQAQWGRDWLEAQWRILPPYDLMRHYEKKLASIPAVEPRQITAPSVSKKRRRK